MKSTIITDVMRSADAALVWRAVVQTACLVGYCLLTESISATVWGALWTPRRFRARLVTILLVGLCLVGLAASVPASAGRIENAGGVAPTLFLLLFSGTSVWLAGRTLIQITAHRRRARPSLWVSQAVISAFALDSLSLLVSFIIHGGAEGRDDGGVLWFSCVAATAVLTLSARNWPYAQRSDEYKALNLWKELYRRWGQGNVDDVLAQRKLGGVSFAWVVIARETADLIALHSRKVPIELQDDETLAHQMFAREHQETHLSPPRVINDWDEIVAIARPLDISS